MGRRVLGRERFETLARQARRRLAGSTIKHPDHDILKAFMATGVCNIDHARKRLRYSPEFDLPKGLASTAAYLKKFAL